MVMCDVSVCFLEVSLRGLGDRIGPLYLRHVVPMVGFMLILSSYIIYRPARYGPGCC